MKTTKSFRVVGFVIVLLAVTVFMYPLFIMLRKSLMYLGFENYRIVFEAVDIRPNLRNSFTVVLLTMLGVSIVSSMAAFAFSKMRFRGGKILFVTVLMGMMIPASATVFPLFQIIKSLKLVNSPFSLVGPYIASNAIFNLLVLKNYYDGLPNEVIEAGTIDGAHTWQIFTHIMFPLALPGLSIVLVQTFLSAWNELQLGMIFINEPAHQTLSVVPMRFAQQMTGRYPLEVFYACMVICVSPVLIFYIFAQRLMISGITSGAVKG